MTILTREVPLLIMDFKKTIEKLARGSAEIINIANLEKKLKWSHKTKQPLRIKAGFDPTAPDIHLGHVVLLRKLKQFQDIGHTVYFLIGDFTALVGDPTGRDQLRPRLTVEEIKENAKTYKKQVFKILDKEKTKVVFNSQWLAKLSSHQMLALTAHSTVAQMLARADFKKRFEDGAEISLLEFIYPLLQGYDSIQLKADVELGGTDQKFNLLMGRQLQEANEQDPQVVMMTPLLEGTDGVKKMSKSLNNYIGINETPNEIFGKIMSINDELMLRYFEVLTDRGIDEVKQMHPKEAKLLLAEDIVAQFYDRKFAIGAREEFIKTFSLKQRPSDILVYKLKTSVVEDLMTILLLNKMVVSNNEYRRLIKQGGISFNGEKIDQLDWVVKPGIIKVGKRRFIELI